MTKPKKKITSIRSIAEVVAREQGISRSLAKAVVEQTFMELAKQLCETGYVGIPAIGTFNIGLFHKIKGAQARLNYRPGKKIREFLATATSDPKNEAFLEYLLERDGAKYDRVENCRVFRRAKAKGYIENDLNRAKEKIAKFGVEQLGVTIDTSLLTEEYLTPPVYHKAILPDHFVSMRSLLEKAGGLPPKKSDDPPSPEVHNPGE